MNSPWIVPIQNCSLTSNHRTEPCREFLTIPGLVNRRRRRMSPADSLHEFIRATSWTLLARLAQPCCIAVVGPPRCLASSRGNNDTCDIPRAEEGSSDCSFA